MTNAPTILLLDGEHVLRRATALMLSNRGGRVSAAATLDEALEYARRRTYDVAVLDLPGRGGSELLARMRERGCVPRKVILCSTLPMAPLDTDGFADVIMKPFAFEQLLRAVFGRCGPPRPLRSGAPPRSGLFPRPRRLKVLRRAPKAQHDRG
jgi:DNA-binding response OmpR family regulator